MIAHIHPNVLVFLYMYECIPQLLNHAKYGTIYLRRCKFNKCVLRMTTMVHSYVSLSKVNNFSVAETLSESMPHKACAHKKQWKQLQWHLNCAYLNPWERNVSDLGFWLWLQFYILFLIHTNVLNFSGYRFYFWHSVLKTNETIPKLLCCYKNIK